MSKAKRIGTKAETMVVKYLQEKGFKDVRRVVLNGRNDKGDIHVGSSDNPSMIFEVKSRKNEATYKEVESFMQELKTEAINVWGKDLENHAKSLLVIKRPGKGKVDDWWAIWEQDNINVRCRFGDLIEEM